MKAIEEVYMKNGHLIAECLEVAGEGAGGEKIMTQKVK